MRRRLQQLKYALLTFVLFATPLFAAERTHTFSSGIVAVLYDTPCTNKELLMRVNTEYQPKFQGGRVTFASPMREAELCWMFLEDGENLFILDTEGNMGLVPVATFMPKPGV